MKARCRTAISKVRRRNPVRYVAPPKQSTSMITMVMMKTAMISAIQPGRTGRALQTNGGLITVGSFPHGPTRTVILTPRKTLSSRIPHNAAVDLLQCATSHEGWTEADNKCAAQQMDRSQHFSACHPHATLAHDPFHNAVSRTVAQFTP